MSVTEAELLAIRDSFHKAEEARELETSPILYDNFFRRAPDKRSMFRDDLAGQGMRFMGMLRVIVNALTDEASLKTALTPLAEGHGALGVAAKDYPMMTEAVIDTFRDVLGDDFKPEMETAWRSAFGRVNDLMAELSDAK